MAKDNKVMFLCDVCGFESTKWQGKCPGCDNWNTMKEFNVYSKKNDSVKSKSFTVFEKPVSIKEIEITNEIRYQTGLTELDRVLGGGIVKGSLVLIAGDPGIGKSTLILQICQSLGNNQKILYVSGEESTRQLKLRADRLKVDTDNLYIFAKTEIGDIIEVINSEHPDIVFIDSIQTMSKEDVSSAPGSVTQVRECTLELMRVAKDSQTSILLVGHVNKEGALAGPKVLEHMVDAVLYFEGERHLSYRMLRAAKNRFGSTNEIGIFEMTDSGLVQIENPSLVLLSGRPTGASGICAVCTMEGTRPIITEVQSLVTPTNYNMPRRTSSGIDYNKMSLLIAILEKRAGIKLATQDTYVNIIGGLQIDDPAADLSIILAIASSAKDKIIDSNTLAIGEVGLAGEIRNVNNIEIRVSEAARLGFKTILIPKSNKLLKTPPDVELLYVRNISEVFALLF